ncbi:DUF2510 domain-containing protein [Agromyces mediolanus]|uniref:DUF2510 domain-containing protein n=1 Tax=Agromyces mediolanus TaxID=41986 RepID=UPI00203AB68D|nr:DUF2510 domain-containing protein [Agromyces mediolanus]MCM3658039.1 DUF2510 domain-containing protein [Agromyces mediolanus]
MTDANGQQITPGWYPDPAGGGGQRWWDGIGWTEHVAPGVPAAPAPAAPLADPPAAGPAPYRGYATQWTRVPVGTKSDTVWVWLIVFIPLIGIFGLFFWDVQGYLRESMANPYGSSLSMMLDPWYLSMMVIGWVSYGLLVWFSYLDYAALGRLGFQRRFHWAWAFLWSAVYVVGRSVFVRRQSGNRGSGPLWAVIAVNVAAFLIALIWMIWFFAQVYEAVRGMPMTSY